MAAPREIVELVERFERNLDAYRSGSYNETQLRREFIDPFFKALGWDVDNEKGYAEPYKDVIHEDAIRIGMSTTAPDYCFRIGGTRKFFVEAKKPSVDIKDDIHPSYQLRRYAWSAKLPLSILTDFEELAVYDCRQKPIKTDKASTARVNYITYDQYLEKWDEIVGIFSPDAIRKGSFDKYAETKRLKKGTAEVDDAFLTDIESWREDLAKNIAARNENISVRQLNFAVQRTIDRIIFLRICEDRGVEDYGKLRALLNGNEVYHKLLELFYDADDRYNSGLFHFHKEKERHESPDEITPDLDIDDSVLKGIIKSLYYPESPYEFSVLLADILGQVYEQFLGKVIRLTAGGRAVIDDKPEVKKAGGVYYTPTYIVDYIVKNTVGKLLENKTPKQASELCILDPACGSGSFLIGAYQYLLDWHRDWYVEDGAEKYSKGSSPKLYQVSDKDWRLTSSERKCILLNNIYGVDIDSQAVEVTKLSLLLKVLEGATRDILERQLKFVHERALPDLGDNIKCGNSLIGNDFYDGEQMSLIESEEEHYRINAFDWHTEFPEIFSCKNPGFDAVIGDPPWGASYDIREKAYFLKHYSHQDYQFDSYMLFIERGISVLHKNGLWGMIIPNPWLTNIRQKNLRSFVFSNKIESIRHFNQRVFPKVTVDVEILILSRANSPNKSVSIEVVSREGDTKQIYRNQSIWRKQSKEPINIFMDDSANTLIQKIKERSSELHDFCKVTVGIKPYQKGKGKPAQTRNIVENRIFDSEHKKDNTYRRYLYGKDINRYVIYPLVERWISFGIWLAEPRPSANFDAAEKILVRQTGDSPIATLDVEQYLCLNNMHVVENKSDLDIRYILGLMNSRLNSFYYSFLNPEKGEALAEVKKAFVEKFPIHLIDFSKPDDKGFHDKMVNLVTNMLTLNKNLLSAKIGHEKTYIQRRIDAIDRQIDQLVYELYGLTEEEIKKAEGKMRLSNIK